MFRKPITLFESPIISILTMEIKTLKVFIIITIIKILKITSIQVMIQPHNRGISFSQYISALAISDILGLLIGELLFSLAAPSSTPIKLSTKGPTWGRGK